MHCAPALTWKITYSAISCAKWDRMESSNFGCRCVMLLIFVYVRVVFPSTMYVANVHGEPTNPRIAAASPTYHNDESKDR